MNLASFDLNLLRAFDALMRDQNVTRAGQRIGLSQPAMSGALQRLRLLLDDQLFVRRGTRMVPTPHAQEIIEPIRQALQQIQTVLEPRTFAPAGARRKFQIAADDLGAAIILPALAERQSRSAPGIDIEVVTESSERSLELLASGRVEIALGTYSSIPDHVDTSLLFTAPCVCAMRTGHPLAGRTLDLETFAGAPQLVVQGGGICDIDARLAKHGLQRRIALSVPNFLVAPFVLTRTNLIAVVPLRLVQRYRFMIDLECAVPPFDVNVTSTMVWDRSSRDDAPNEWLRSQIQNVAQEYAVRMERSAAAWRRDPTKNAEIVQRSAFPTYPGTAALNPTDRSLPRQ